MTKTPLKADTTSLKGIVTRRLYSREKFYNSLVDLKATFSDSWENMTLSQIYLEASKQLNKETIDRLLDKAAKKQFKDNALWKFLKKNFGVDLAIPFVTGRYTTKAIRGNLVPTRGKRIVADQVGGTTTAPVTAIAIGVGAVAAAAGDTALGSESTTNGGSRGAATVTNTTTTTTGDTEQWVKTFTFSGSLAITEEGLFDNNTSGGNMLARQVFSAVNVVNGDTLQVTHKVQVS